MTNMTVPPRIHAAISASWAEVDGADMSAIADWVKQELHDAPESERFTAGCLPSLVADILLGRLRDPLLGLREEVWTPGTDWLLNIYGRAWGEHTTSLLTSAPSLVAGRTVAEFSELVKEVALAARCSASHPLFSFAREDATEHQLALLLDAENLCDLNFVHLLAPLSIGLDGTPMAEVAENLWDEWGHGRTEGFHRNIRLRMMSAVGLDIEPDSLFRLERYTPQEIEHFNAYMLNGVIRGYNRRLVGMMFATEFLVPQQLNAIVDGWRRVGLADTDMQYLIDHQVGDVEHADGWADSVVSPIIDSDSSAQTDLLLGVLQHLDILGRLYDRLLLDLTHGVTGTHTRGLNAIAQP